MLHTKGHERVSYSRLLEFLVAVDKLYPTSLSLKVSLPKYAKKLHENATICFHEEDGKIVGVVAGYTENTINNAAFVSMVGVLPEYQRKGIAEELVKEFIDRANHKRLDFVHLYAVKENTPAVKLYKKLGFVEWYFENDPRPEDVHFIFYLQRKTALVTAIGSFSADIVIKNLKKNGFKVIGCDIYSRELIADAYNVSDFYQVPKVANEEEYLKALKYVCTEEKITHILPSTDIEIDFFNKYREEFEKTNIVICISPPKTLEICRNKKLQQEFIEKNVECIQYIPTKYVKECGTVPYDYPLVCKPVDGRSSQGLRYVYTKEDWEAVKTCVDRDNYIVQPKIIGNIVTVDIVRSQDGEVVVAIPRLELLRTQNGAGTSVKVYTDLKLENNCKVLADKLGVIGCVNFEFLRDDEGTYYYVECNPRFSGGVEFSCLAGYDCVSNHVRAFENNKIDEFQLNRNMYIARKYEEYVTRII